MGAYYKTTIQLFSKWHLFGIDTEETKSTTGEWRKITTVSLFGWQIVKIQNTKSNPANTPESISERILAIKNAQPMDAKHSFFHYVFSLDKEEIDENVYEDIDLNEVRYFSYYDPRRVYIDENGNRDIENAICSEPYTLSDSLGPYGYMLVFKGKTEESEVDAVKLEYLFKQYFSSIDFTDRKRIIAFCDYHYYSYKGKAIDWLDYVSTLIRKLPTSTAAEHRRVSIFSEWERQKRAEIGAEQNENYPKLPLVATKINEQRGKNDPTAARYLFIEYFNEKETVKPDTEYYKILLGKYDNIPLSDEKEIKKGVDRFEKAYNRISKFTDRLRVTERQKSGLRDDLNFVINYFKQEGKIDLAEKVSEFADKIGINLI